MGDFSVQVYCLAAISELRGAVLKVLTWDVVNPGSVPCYGVRIWTRHSRDLKSDLPFPWGSNLTLDYWLSGVSVLVCFFTDKRTGLRLAPRDISWQRTLSAKRTSQKNKNITLIHYPLQPYLQHPTGKVTTQTWHFLPQGKHWMVPMLLLGPWPDGMGGTCNMVGETQHHSEEVLRSTQVASLMLSPG